MFHYQSAEFGEYVVSEIPQNSEPHSVQTYLRKLSELLHTLKENAATM